jgi:hypothetical protein
MFRPCDVIIRLALEHFKTNTQIALLEMGSHFLHSVCNLNECTYVRTYTVAFF